MKEGGEDSEQAEGGLKSIPAYDKFVLTRKYYKRTVQSCPRWTIPASKMGLMQSVTSEDFIRVVILQE
jgi:hypothetical protein